MNLFANRKLSTTAGLGLSLAATVAFVAACGSSSGSTSASAPSSSAGSSSTAVSISAHQGSLGTYLTDKSGRTLYLFGSDTGSKSTCSGSCSAQWPPLTTTGKPSAGSGIAESKLTTIKRSGGGMQVAYNHHPLYYFSGDSSANQTNGQGLNAFGARWYVLSSGGSQITKAAPSSSGGGVSGY